jgi:N-acyl-L-homoserine lactone synthetase
MSPAASTSRTDGAAALDRLSRRLIKAAAPWRVAVARDGEELDAILRLRHRQVVEHGWTGEPLPGGIERDAYDAGALHIGAWDGAALAGAMRLVLPAAGRRLPVEEAFGIGVEPRGAVAEAGRLVIAPERRGDPAHRVWGALFAVAWIELRARGLTVLAGAASPGMVERLRALGLPFEVLGPARRHWGQERHPVRLDPARAQPRWYDG